MVLRMVKEHSENSNSMKRTQKPLKKNQSEMKNTISEMKNILEGIKSRVDEGEDLISNLDKVAEHTQ